MKNTTNIKKFKLFILSIVLACFVSNIIGCSATHTAIRKRNLDVQTKMSATVFLEPVSQEKRTVFVQVRNTTDKTELDIDSRIKAAVMAKGYKIVDDPEEANFLLQANVLQIGKADLREAEHAVNGGYGAALSGGLIGAGAGAVTSGHKDAVIIGAAVGALASWITDAMVKDVSYSAITDIQVSERVAKNLIVREKVKSKLKQGTATTKEVTSNEKIKWKKYQTRIVSTANKVNLKFEEAQDKLISGLTRSIAGIF